MVETYYNCGMSTATPLLNFNKSNLRKKLFLYFFTNPERRHYLREIAELLNVDPTNLSRELKRLELEGVFSSETSGHQKYFLLNKNFQLYDELKTTIHKTIGVPAAISEVLRQSQGVLRAFVYGSFAKGTESGHSDVDVCLIIKKLVFRENPILEGFKSLENTIGREISYVFFTKEEWERKHKNKDSLNINVHCSESPWFRARSSRFQFVTGKSYLLHHE